MALKKATQEANISPRFPRYGELVCGSDPNSTSVQGWSQLTVRLGDYAYPKPNNKDSPYPTDSMSLSIRKSFRICTQHPLPLAALHSGV